MKDAWQQLQELQQKFTKTWRVRDDLEVTADPCDRSVIFSLGFHSTQRNDVGTMRELATALLAACDHVDKSNPKWAGFGLPLMSAEEMEEK